LIEIFAPLARVTWLNENASAEFSGSAENPTMDLEWSDAAGNGNPLQVKLTLTHEEIAEMIGTSRETVSRLFSEFKKRELVQVKGATLVIRNKAALEEMVTT
jgi:CRP-like cAMP-binding protein